MHTIAYIYSRCPHIPLTLPLKGCRKQLILIRMKQQQYHATAATVNTLIKYTDYQCSSVCVCVRLCVISVTLAYSDCLYRICLCACKQEMLPTPWWWKSLGCDHRKFSNWPFICLFWSLKKGSRRCIKGKQESNISSKRNTPRSSPSPSWWKSVEFNTTLCIGDWANACVCVCEGEREIDNKSPSFDTNRQMLFLLPTNLVFLLPLCVFLLVVP